MITGSQRTDDITHPEINSDLAEMFAAQQAPCEVRKSLKLLYSYSH